MKNLYLMLALVAGCVLANGASAQCRGPGCGQPRFYYPRSNKFRVENTVRQSLLFPSLFRVVPTIVPETK